jgi:hypothetical protein
MSEESRTNDISKRVVVYRMPETDTVTVRRDVVYRSTDAGDLTMDVYRPPDAAADARVPAVVLVAGYPDHGVVKFLGCRFKELGSSTSWASLIAASGVAAIAYANREPEGDLHAVLGYVRENAASLGIDERRIGVWASSGNVPLALSVLMRPDLAPIRCAALCYGFLLDTEGTTVVADASKAYGFSNPCAGRAVADLPSDLPLFLARAGRDEFPHLNETLDRFVADALARNMPVTVANHATGPHAFDLLDDTDDSREVVRQILAFLRFRLSR